MKWREILKLCSAFKSLGYLLNYLNCGLPEPIPEILNWVQNTAQASVLTPSTPRDSDVDGKEPHLEYPVTPALVTTSVEACLYQLYFGYKW